MSQTTENPMRKISLEKVVQETSFRLEGQLLNKFPVKTQQQEKPKKLKEIGELERENQ
jgi:hypothetical protein